MPKLLYPGYEKRIHAGHAALDNLRDGKVLDLEGMRFRMVVDDDGLEAELQPGDTYIGARNTVDVYVVRRVDEENGWVFPDGMGYPFNIGECVKVVEAAEDEGPVIFALSSAA